MKIENLIKVASLDSIVIKDSGIFGLTYKEHY
jgi:hypothetical protein